MNPQHPQLLEAVVAHKNGRLKEAEAAYKKILATGDNSECSRLYAELLIEIGERDRAIEVLGDAIASGAEDDRESVANRPRPSDGLYWEDTSLSSTLADLLYKKGEIRESKKYAHRALAANPSDIYANKLWVTILCDENRVDQAILHYRSSPDSIKKCPIVCEQLAAILIHLGRFEEGIKIRNNGRHVPQLSLAKIQSHIFKEVRIDHMIPRAGAAPHPEVKVLDIKKNVENFPIFVALENATLLSGEWLVLSDKNTLFNDANHGTPTGDPPYYLCRRRSPLCALPMPVRRPAAEKAILVGGDNNYYHWLVDFLPRLMALSKTPELKDYPILIHEGLLAYQRESLEMAGLPADRLVHLEYPACYSFKELVVPLFPPGHSESQINRGRHSAVSWLRSLVPPVAGKARKIYISRRDSRRRKIANEDALASLLEKEGFEICSLAGKTLREQIDMFSRAEMIVSVHGAGFGNLAFAPDRCRVVEIYGPGWHNDQFKGLAEVRGQEYHGVQCRTHFAKASLPVFSDYYLTEQAIGEILDIVRRKTS